MFLPDKAHHLAVFQSAPRREAAENALGLTLDGAKSDGGFSANPGLRAATVARRSRRKSCKYLLFKELYLTANLPGIRVRSGFAGGIIASSAAMLKLVLGIKTPMVR